MLQKFDLFIFEHARIITNDPDIKNVSTVLGDKTQNKLLALLASNNKKYYP